MCPASKTRNRNGRCQSIKQNWDNSWVRVFTRDDARERPRFNGVAGRECIPASKESNALPLYLRPWSLRDKLQHIERDIGIDQTFDPNAAGIPRAWILHCFSWRFSDLPSKEIVFLTRH